MTEDSRRIEDMLSQLMRTVDGMNSVVSKVQAQVAQIQTQMDALEKQIETVQHSEEDMKSVLNKTEHNLNVADKWKADREHH